jgi:UDP-N-acetylmuramate: L-alanyl-gamma-D-glutamyl-meso-diaminopimelate ligase
MLKAWGIRALTPYSPQNLDEAKPDLVIIGNVIRRVNPEATAVRERRLPSMSFPAALGSLFLKDRHSVVIAGTHGKTTTSALMGHVLASAGRDPTFLVGGVTRNYGGNYRLGKGPHFVVEGDEYDTAYFDKGPKFLHYQPRTVILTSVELDHADIYRDLDHYESSFEKLVELIPPGGTLVVCSSYPNALRLAKRCRGRVIEYAAAQATFSSEGARFSAGGGELLLPMGGRHNVENAMGVYAAARALGLTHDEVRQGFATFQGVKRRQEERGTVRGVLVIDDFAHHPTAVRETIAAVKGRYAGRRLVAVFEPRSNTSRRNLHQEEYAGSFGGADLAFVKVPEKHDKIPEGQGLDVPRLVTELSARGIPTEAGATVEGLVGQVTAAVKAGDVVLVMSNGGFGGFIEKLLRAMEAKT